MGKRSGWNIARLLIAGMTMGVLVSFTACQGPQGPMGPAGPAGPGAQTTYVFNVTPTDASGTYEAGCPAVIVDNVNDDYSTVSCYLHFTGYDDAPLVPYTDTEGDATTTHYFYSLENGKVILGWVNSATTIPDAFELVVTVVH